MSNSQQYQTLLVHTQTNFCIVLGLVQPVTLVYSHPKCFGHYPHYLPQLTFTNFTYFTYLTYLTYLTILANKLHFFNLLLGLSHQFQPATPYVEPSSTIWCVTPNCCLTFSSLEMSVTFCTMINCAFIKYITLFA